jgi:molybdopterin-guanine dinucleotide biosynthesis protein A
MHQHDAVVSTEPVTVLILAGGRSRRMGRDKLWLELNGQPLVAHVVERVRLLADEIIFSTGQQDRFAELSQHLGLPTQIVSDDLPGAGPLAGLAAGLSAARNELVLALAADMPFVSLPLLAYMRALAAGYDAVLPLLPDAAGELRREPLHAFYRRTCLDAIGRRLAAGTYQVVSFLPDVRVRDVSLAEVRQFDPDRLSFFNVNTPEDWRNGLEIAARAAPGGQGSVDKPES